MASELEKSSFDEKKGNKYCRIYEKCCHMTYNCKDLMTIIGQYKKRKKYTSFEYIDHSKNELNALIQKKHEEMHQGQDKGRDRKRNFYPSQELQISDEESKKPSSNSESIQGGISKNLK